MGQFLALFHRYGWIYRPFTGDGWLSANEKWVLTDSEILKAIACVHPKFYLGARADKATRFAVLDIDAGSKYHNPKQLALITDVLAGAGIKETNLYRSSYSGGWHLYIFFDEKISSRDLRSQLIQLLRLNGFDIAKGTLEVFPAPGDSRHSGSMGNGLRLPLQPGFAWLNHNGHVREERDGLSPAEALDRFMQDIECASNTWHDFHQLKATVARLAESQEKITTQLQEMSQITKREGVVVPFKRPEPEQPDEYALATVLEVFQELPPGMNAASWVRGREFAQTGLTGKSQRAEAIFCLSHYLFYGDPARQLPPLGYGYEKERQWAIESTLKSMHNGCSKDINRGRGDAVAQVERAATWCPKRLQGKELKPFRKTVPISWQRNSANLKSEAVKKIQAAVADFEEAGAPFSVRDLKLKTGCSTDTLYRHKLLWKPVQARLQNGRLESVPGEYNAVVGAYSQEIGALPQCQAKIMPPGRLAARRIVHEIKMRAKRDSLDRRNLRRFGWKPIDSAWRRDLEKVTPESFSGLETGKLRALLAIYISAVPTCPDEDHELWIRGLIGAARAELATRPKQLELIFSKDKNRGSTAPSVTQGEDRR